jgi:hypothetical protein
MGLAAFLIKVWDGVNTMAVKAASTAPLPSDPAAVVTLSPNCLGADNSTNSSNKLPTLDARANAAAQAWTENAQVPLSVDLAGNLRILLESWFGSNAPTVGSKTSANSIPVVIASDQASVPTTTAKSGTSTLTGVSASASSVSLLASNTSRLGGTIVNDTTSATLYVRLSSSSAAATSGNYTTILPPGAYYEIPFGYTGAIQGIWTAATGFANVDELTA